MMAAAAVAAVVLASGPPAAWVGLTPSSPVSTRFAGVARRAQGGYDRKKLEKEATASADFLKGFQNFFGGGGQPQEASQDQKDAVERRRMNSIAIEKALRPQALNILTGEDEEGNPMRRPAPIAVLQTEAKQSLAIFAATKEEALLDILLSMRISAKDFAERNVLVVPVLIDRETKKLIDLSPKIMKAKLMKQGAIAIPAPEDEEDRSVWGELFAAEFDEAELDGMGAVAASQGLALLVRKTGEIARRGVGRPDWSVIFQDLGI